MVKENDGNSFHSIWKHRFFSMHNTGTHTSPYILKMYIYIYNTDFEYVYNNV